MSESCTIVIGAADVLPTLKERTAAVNGEVLGFSDADAIRALEAIVKRRPRVVTIEKTFASTPRGAALINRIKADPALIDLEIQVVAHDSGYARIVRQGTSPPAPPRIVAPASPPPTPAAAPARVLAPPATVLEPPPAPLDHRGTRRAQRTRFSPPLDIAVDGNAALLVDVSTVGAQVISPAALKPNQRVRLALTDDQGSVRVTGSVAWASFEISKNGPRYRAGVEFVKPDEAAIEAFCMRHQQA